MDDPLFEMTSYVSGFAGTGAVLAGLAAFVLRVAPDRAAYWVIVIATLTGTIGFGYWLLHVIQ